MSEPAVERANVPPPPAARAARVALALIALGGVLTALALRTPAARASFAFSYLWGFTFLWTIVLGSLFFVALQHLTRSVWSVVIRRVAESLAAEVWVAAVLFLPILLFAFVPERFPLFPWLDARAVAAEPLLARKAPYLNLPFFALRAAVYFALWHGFSMHFVRGSLGEDEAPAGAAGEASERMRKASAPFMLVFAFTATFASFDWLMSLDATWHSTIFGVYVFSGMVGAALAAITLATLALRSRGRLGDGIVTGDHLYSLGALLFAFACFWGYIAFSQFMLIWYANIPDETQYFVRRIQAGWWWVSLALPVVRFAIPFALLLGRPAKMDPRKLVLASIVVLAGELLDLYWLIFPESSAAGPPLAAAHLGPPLLMAGVLVLFVSRFLGRHRTVATGDPLFEESRRFHL